MLETDPLKLGPGWRSIAEHRRVLAKDDDVLRYLLAQVDGNHFVDIGCCIGGFTSVMANIAKRRGGHVYSIDLFADYPITWADTPDRDSHYRRNLEYPVKEYFKDNMRAEGVLDVITIIQRCSWDAAGDFANDKMDFIWIDADHEYESVKKDIEAWYPKLKRGGIIAGHDYEWVSGGVRDAVIDAFKEPMIHSATGLIWSWRKP